MVRARTVTVEISITEHEDGLGPEGTRSCTVVVRYGGEGGARRRQSGQDGLEIGDELAPPGALVDLAHKAVDIIATGGVERAPRRSMRLLS